MFDNFSNSEFLKKSQYKNADNLNARIRLHQQFSTNTEDWHGWAFTKADIQTGQNILEIGCGPGKLWELNADFLPVEINPILSDLSFGMVNTAKNIKKIYPNFNFVNSDSMVLPFKKNCFDRIIANHMLYHVPDISLGIKEAARVLNSDGVFIAATNGENHMLESFTLVSNLLPEFVSSPRILRRFNLENGTAQLQEHFQSVSLYHYEDSLQVTDPQALVDYLVSLWGSYFDQTIINSLTNLITLEIEAKGFFFIQKSTGIFIAKNPK